MSCLPIEQQANQSLQHQTVPKKREFMNISKIPKTKKFYEEYDFLSSFNIHEALKPKHRLSSEFVFTPSLNADIQLTPEVFTLFVSAQLLHQDKEISGMGYTQNGILQWAAFGEVGEGQYVVSEAEKTALILKECVQQTGNAPNTQIHTHPNMSAFWSSTDLNAQYQMLDALQETTKERFDIYFIVYSICRSGYGILYALTRRVLFEQNMFYYNDGKLSILDYVFPSKETEKQNTPQAPEPAYSHSDYKTTPITYTPSSVPVTKPTQKQQVKSYAPSKSKSEYEKAKDALQNGKSPEQFFPFFAALAAALELHANAKITSKPPAEIQQKIDTAKHIDDLPDKNIKINEIMRYVAAIQSTPNTLWKITRLSDIVRALDLYFDDDPLSARKYIEEKYLDLQFCESVSSETISEIFPERTNFLMYGTAPDLAQAFLKTEKRESMLWLKFQLKAADGWFQYQVYDLLQEKPILQNFLFSDSLSGIPSIDHYLNTIVEAQTLENVRIVLQTMTIAEIIELSKHTDRHPNIKQLFQKVQTTVGPCLYGYVLYESGNPIAEKRLFQQKEKNYVYNPNVR
jgi:hypothetical protein